MHIEINAGGLGGLAIAEYQLNMSNLISDAEKVISSFKSVVNSTHELSGGVGSLQDAVNEVSSRIQSETEKKDAVVEVQRKSNDFLELAKRVDGNVSALVNKNKEEFYNVNPWLRPPEPTTDDRNWAEKAWDWLCGKGEEIVEGTKKALKWVGDTAKKAWDGLVEFYEEYKKIIDTVLIAVGAVLAIVAVVATGGLAMVPLLGAIGVSTATAIAISTTVAVVAVVSTVVASTMNVVDIWCEIDNPIFNTFQKAVNVISTVSNLTYSIGTIYNSIKKITPEQYIAKNPVETPKYTSVNQLSKKQISALEDYSGVDFQNINSSLRGMEKATPENVQRIKTLTHTIDNASLPQDMTLYRGTTTNALGDLKNLAPDELIGKSFVEKGFMSTSTKSSVGNAFKHDMQITINAAKGSHAMDIASVSNYANEAEVLFSAGQEMIITGAEKINGILHITVSIF